MSISLVSNKYCRMSVAPRLSSRSAHARASGEELHQEAWARQIHVKTVQGLNRAIRAVNTKMSNEPPGRKQTLGPSLGPGRCLLSRAEWMCEKRRAQMGSETRVFRRLNARGDSKYMTLI